MDGSLIITEVISISINGKIIMRYSISYDLNFSGYTQQIFFIFFIFFFYKKKRQQPVNTKTLVQEYVSCRKPFFKFISYCFESRCVRVGVKDMQQVFYILDVGVDC